MDNPERGIAILHVVDQNSNGEKVVNFVELLVFPGHLLENAINMFRTAADVALNAHFLKLLFDPHEKSEANQPAARMILVTAHRRENHAAIWKLHDPGSSRHKPSSTDSAVSSSVSKQG